MVQESTIYVREVTSADVKYNETAATVVNTAYRSKGGWTTEEHIVGGQRATSEDINDMVLSNGKPNVLLYAFDSSDTEKVIGTVQIQHHDSKEAEIGLFSVSPDYQSKGVGGRLMRGACERMKELGYTTATLHVLENRPELLAWYAKLGFKETGERVPFVWPEMLKIKDLHFLTLKKDL
ncbi:acyl-CoA N-acyltransferase [Lichtheimia hyalospora FSU 10163]|nr:acyl-CoA N-acyltransferase [Lichtheimia hyalospora FSU 10163]